MSRWVHAHDGFQGFVANIGVAVTGFFYGDLTPCSNHARRLQPLQPCTDYDREKGFGSPCPFCEGGPLAGQHSQLRSRKRLAEALECWEWSAETGWTQTHGCDGPDRQRGALQT